MMKTRRMMALIGSLSLLCSNAVFAHNNDRGYIGPAVTGGVAVWADSYGNVQYAGNVAYGSPYVYVAEPYYGHAHIPGCNHRSHYAYERGYNKGYRYGARKSGKHRHKHHRRGGYGKHGH